MITIDDYIKAAAFIGCEVAAIKAIDAKEARGEGFLKDGRLKILFEGHKFYQYTNGKFAKSNPTICHKIWTKTFYLGNEAEYTRFNQAFSLDKTAAMLSTSWGRFQIMGFNFKGCGYNSVDEMIDSFKESEKNQLMAFCELVKFMRIDDELVRKDWKGFAKVYNGAGYAANNYDKEIQKLYTKFS